MSALWIMAVITFAVFALAMLAHDFRARRRDIKRRLVTMNALYEEWRRADEEYFAYMRGVLDAQRRGDHVKYQSMQSTAADLWVKAIAAQRKAQRS